MTEFTTRFQDEVEAGLTNSYPKRSFDFTTLEPLSPRSYRLGNMLKAGLKRLIYRKVLPSQKPSDYLRELEEVYQLLDDSYSKDLLVKILAYRELGFQHFRLPLYSHDFVAKIKKLERYIEGDDRKTVPAVNWDLRKFNLSELGFPLQLFSIPMCVHLDFVLKQYEYDRGGVQIRAKEGDNVLDLGGFIGDTALYLAHLIGEGGRVFSLEFIPSNLHLLRTNLELNPDLARRIEVIERPVWSHSAKKVHFADCGPSSRVSFNNLKNKTGCAESISVDDIVSEFGIDKVDFIKMDIEGAEMSALKGASKTLRMWRPSLAIAIYHSLQDMMQIPEYISDLDLGYSMFLDHYTIHRSETILYATIAV